MPVRRRLGDPEPQHVRRFSGGGRWLGWRRTGYRRSAIKSARLHLSQWPALRRFPVPPALPEYDADFLCGDGGTIGVVVANQQGER